MRALGMPKQCVPRILFLPLCSSDHDSWLYRIPLSYSDLVLLQPRKRVQRHCRYVTINQGCKTVCRENDSHITSRIIPSSWKTTQDWGDGRSTSTSASTGIADRRKVSSGVFQRVQSSGQIQTKSILEATYNCRRSTDWVRHRIRCRSRRRPCCNHRWE